MPSIAHFSLSLDKINDSGTFSEGDTIRGQVSLELLRATEVLSLSVKAKGDANAAWKPMASGFLRTFRRPPSLFKTKEELICADAQATLTPGPHRLGFTVHLPPEPLPSSFRGAYGSVVYCVEAKLVRRHKKPRRVRQEIGFFSRNVEPPPSAEESQSHRVASRVDGPRFQGRSSIINVSVDGKVFSPGGQISVVAKIFNFSGRDLEPIFFLLRSEEYRSRRHKKTEINCLQTEFTPALKAGGVRQDTCALQVPHDAGLTVHHCEALSVDFLVLVSLGALPAHLETELPVVIVARDALPAAPPPRQANGESS
ncbi:arrestin domain-containing protein 3-like [Eucyclogobius newberryi]|uniref:arrestin domain-containing protein 3-like n=1 Tax=Eucyclogobius newberryi TaxID=166745 RepID=UPI003B5CD78C